VVAGRVSGRNCSHAPVKLLPWYLSTLVGTTEPLSKGVSDFKFRQCLSYLPKLTPLSFWPHLFRGAGYEKRGEGEQLKWSLAFRLYIGSFPCAQLPGPVHTARLGRVFFCVFSLGLFFVCSFVLFDLFVCPNSFMFP